MSYHFSKVLNDSFEEAIDKVTRELKEEGFGILTEIDVKETFKRNWILISGNTGSLAHVILKWPIRQFLQKVRLEQCFL